VKIIAVSHPISQNIKWATWSANRCGNQISQEIWWVIWSSRRLAKLPDWPKYELSYLVGQKVRWAIWSSKRAGEIPDFGKEVVSYLFNQMMRRVSWSTLNNAMRCLVDQKMQLAGWWVTWVTKQSCAGTWQAFHPWQTILISRGTRMSTRSLHLYSQYNNTYRTRQIWLF
jgi:hypothetical protein